MRGISHSQKNGWRTGLGVRAAGPVRARAIAFVPSGGGLLGSPLRGCNRDPALLSLSLLPSSSLSVRVVGAEVGRIPLSPGGSPSFVSRLGVLQSVRWLAVDPEESGHAPLSFFPLTFFLCLTGSGLDSLCCGVGIAGLGTRDAVQCSGYMK